MLSQKHVLIIPTGHFATDVYPFAGIFENHQATALSEFGYKIGVISVGSIPFRKECVQYTYKHTEQYKGILILRKYKRFWLPHRYTSYSVLKKRYLSLFMEQFQRYINHFGVPEIIHAHNFLFSGMIAQEIKRKYKIPYVITEHSSSFALGNISRDLDEEILQCAKDSKHVLAVSTKFASLLSDRYNINCSVLPNILDDFFIHGGFTKLRQQTAFTFLNIANLIENKNHSLLIRAFAKKFKGSVSILRIGGTGHQLNSLKILCKELGVEDQVFFLGLLDRSQVVQEMTNANCFVLSSNYETFGVVLIESLSCGTPVISTKCGGPFDIVNEKNGFLVDVGDEEALAIAMEKVYNKPDYFLPEKLRSDVIDKFGKEAFLAQINTFYA